MNKVVPSNSILIPDEAELVFEGVLFDVYNWQQTLFDGSTATYEMLKRYDTVVTIAVSGDKIIVINDEQPHSGKRLSFPAGTAEPYDESTLDAAKRETLEETGYTFNHWRLIKAVQPSNEIEWFVHIYLAWDEAKVEDQKLDPGERITVMKKDFFEVKDIVKNDDGSLGKNKDIFDQLSSLEELLKLPEFSGKNVNR